MLKNKIIKLMNNLEGGNKDTIKSLSLPSIGFKIESISNKFNISKIGGYPSISEDRWPLNNGKPLLFLGEISLEEISTMNNLLPKKGVLCFFLLVDDIGNRYPDSNGEFKVLYVENQIERFFSKEYNIIKEYNISFFEYYTFPSYQESIIEENNINDEDLYIIEDLESEIQFLINENHGIEHQLLGHPKAVQGTVRFWWSMKYLGFEDLSRLSKDDIKRIKEEESQFILLLQFNFEDPKIEVDHFGESIAYYGIHKQDLENKNFENAVMVIQNT